MSLSPANYTHRMRGIEARRNAAVRDTDCASLHAATQQKVDLNHIFWMGADLAQQWRAMRLRCRSGFSLLLVIIDGGP